MTHREDCPTPYEARREGERAFENGRGSYSNPYRDDYARDTCPDAEREWSYGFRDAERRRDEEREQESREADCARRAQEEREWEEQQYYAQQEEPPPEPPQQEPEPGKEPK
jgi:hypothetical protein